MSETDAVYDNADSETLFQAKMKCLEWAREDNKTIGVNEAIKTAQEYWNFIVFDGNSDEQS